MRANACTVFLVYGAARDLQSWAFILEIFNSFNFLYRPAGAPPSLISSFPVRRGGRGYNCFVPPELGNTASRLRCFILEQGLCYHIQSFCALRVFARLFFSKVKISSTRLGGLCGILEAICIPQVYLPSADSPRAIQGSTRDIGSFRRGGFTYRGGGILPADQSIAFGTNIFLRSAAADHEKDPQIFLL